MTSRKTPKTPGAVGAGKYPGRDDATAASVGVAEYRGAYQSSTPPPMGAFIPGQVWLDEPDDFPAITRDMEGMSDETQVSIIRHGLSANMARSMAQSFDISVGELAKVLLVSESTLTRKTRDNALLDPSTTERLMRIAAITALATHVFEDPSKATAWMTRRNVALGDQAPLSLCDNDISAAQVRRVLRAIEYGGVV